MEYVAKLNYWRIQKITNNLFVIRGEVEGDKLGRFKDGEKIHTFHIQNINVKEGDIVTTKNNKYLLGVKATKIGDLK